MALGITTDDQDRAVDAMMWHYDARRAIGRPLANGDLDVTVDAGDQIYHVVLDGDGYDIDTGQPPVPEEEM